MGSLTVGAFFGMCGYFAALFRAPITAVVILYEASGVYTLVLPALLCSCFAVYVSHLFEEEEFFHRQAREFLEMRGIQVLHDGNGRGRQSSMEIGRSLERDGDSDLDEDDLGNHRLRKGGSTPKEFNIRR